jgi:superfamily II DNA or RNA helicase
MSIPTPRPYQRRAIDAVFAVWDGGQDRVLLSAATGAGKSVMFGAIAREHAAHHAKDGPIVLLAHRWELVEQAAQHFTRANPDFRVETVIGAKTIGRVGSTLRRKTVFRWRHPATRPDVIVTTPQTLASKTTMADFPNPSLVIADECHHYASVSFRNVMTALGCFTGTRSLGVTATPFREDHRKLTEIFPITAASIDISWLINHRTDEDGNEVECESGQGYLVAPRLQHLTIDGLDLSEVPTSMISGAVDYREKELAEAMEAAGAFDLVAKAVIENLSGRKGVLFAPTVRSSKHLAQVITDLGEPCGHVDGMMSKPDRDKVINDFRNGAIRWLSNVGIVSEGFDLPEIDTVVLARPTRSRIFFRQAVGRALRPAPGKDHAIILDVAGASDGHSLAGLNALTDADVLDAKPNEQLIDLLARSDRARRGILDRITAARDELRGRQNTGENGAEQIRLTAEGIGDMVPGVEAFIGRMRPLLDSLLAITTEGIDLAASSVLPPTKTMDDLHAIQTRVADMVAPAARKVAEIELLKSALREALMALQEEPESPVGRAMVTGYVATVAGDLFGEEEERSTPRKPAEVGALKLKRGPKIVKPQFTARVGWTLRSSQGHLYVPVHKGKEVTQLAISVKLPDGDYWPVTWTRGESVTMSAKLDNLSEAPLPTEEEAYRLILNYASTRSTGAHLLNPKAKWRAGAPAGQSLNAARRSNPGFLIPEEADAGYVADVVTSGQYERTVDSVGAHITRMVAEKVSNRGSVTV